MNLNLDIQEALSLEEDTLLAIENIKTEFSALMFDDIFLIYGQIMLIKNGVLCKYLPAEVAYDLGAAA